MEQRIGKEQICVSSERQKIVLTAEESRQLKVAVGNRIVEAFDYGSVAQIASMLRVSHQTVKSYIVGAEFPTIEILLAVQRLTGVSLDWLLTGKESEKTFAAPPFIVSNEREILGLA